MTSTSNRRWAVRGSAALGVAALAAFTLAAPAAAAPVYGDIDFDATGSITIHKHEHQAGTGSLIVGDPEGGSTLPNPIAGVTFTAYAITSLPLEVPASWDTLSTIDAVTAATCPVLNTVAPAAALAGQTLGTGQSFPVTVADGTATLTGLDVGAYLVCETAATTAANIADPAQPFIVTVPFPDNQTGAPSNSDGWLYAVHAYPKNAKAVAVTKTVTSPDGLGLGASVTFPTTTGIPRLADDAQFTSYVVVDPMDPRLAAIAVDSVTVDGTPVDAAHYTVTTDRNVLLVSFTQAGLTWLKGQGGKDVVTVFSGEVSSLASPGFGLDAGQVYNRAYLVTDNEALVSPPAAPQLPPLEGDPTDPVDPTDPFPGDPETVSPSNVVETNWGDVKIFKQDAAGAAPAGLSGAVFEVYAAATPYAATTADCAIATTGGALVVGAASEFTSADGAVTIAGLFVSDSENATADAAFRCYVVKEITAPAGFVLPAGDDAFTAVAVAAGVTSGYDLTIDNVKQNVPNLPLTGGQGQVLLMLGGGALLLTAIGVAVVARRRGERTQ